VGGWAAMKAIERETDTHRLCCSFLLHSTTRQAQFGPSGSFAESHSPRTQATYCACSRTRTTGGAYPGWGLFRVFNLGFWGFGIIPSGSWYSNIGKRTTAVPGIRTCSE
jgi:hypothetical protein